MFGGGELTFKNHLIEMKTQVGVGNWKQAGHSGLRLAMGQRLKQLRFTITNIEQEFDDFVGELTF
jgi:hypothetical protein